MPLRSPLPLHFLPTSYLETHPILSHLPLSIRHWHTLASRDSHPSKCPTLPPFAEANSKWPTVACCAYQMAVYGRLQASIGLGCRTHPTFSSGSTLLKKTSKRANFGCQIYLGMCQGLKMSIEPLWSHLTLSLAAVGVIAASKFPSENLESYHYSAFSTQIPYSFRISRLQDMTAIYYSLVLVLGCSSCLGNIT